MSDLTGPQLAAYARGAGFTGNALTNAVAISFAEDTPHDTAITSANPAGGENVGLWQIWQGNFPGADLADPATNAKAAYTLSKGGKDFGDWETFADGRYQDFLTQAQEALSGKATATGPATGSAAWWTEVLGLGLGVATGNSGTNEADPLAGVGAAIGRLAAEFEGIGQAITWLSLPSHWVRIFAGVGGAGFLAASIYLLGKELRGDT